MLQNLFFKGTKLKSCSKSSSFFSVFTVMSEMSKNEERNTNFFAHFFKILISCGQNKLF